MASFSGMVFALKTNIFLKCSSIGQPHDPEKYPQIICDKHFDFSLQAAHFELSLKCEVGKLNKHHCWDLNPNFHVIDMCLT